MASLAWGGFANGRIATTRLLECPNFAPLGTSPASVANGSHKMEAEAAAQLSGLQQAFFIRFGKKLNLSEGYRGRDLQDWYYDRFIYKKPGWTLAAYPGTSVHGWALSADLNIDGGNPSGEHLAWLHANAPLYGFWNDVSSEPWHWSYRRDIVTRKIVVKAVIANPNVKPEPVGPAKENEDDMPDRGEVLNNFRITTNGKDRVGALFFRSPARGIIGIRNSYEHALLVRSIALDANKTDTMFEAEIAMINYYLVAPAQQSTVVDTSALTKTVENTLKELGKDLAVNTALTDADIAKLSKAVNDQFAARLKS